MARLGYLVLAYMLFQGAAAHYELKYPAPRGFDEALEPLAPCGGFDSVGPRSEFPLKDGFVQIYSGHAIYNYEIKLVAGNAPDANDFTEANVITQGRRNYPEAACLPVDLGAVSGASAGQNATIQIKYNGGDGELYQCADVTLAENPASFNTSQCVNADGSTNNQDDSGSGANALTVAGSLMLAVTVGSSYFLAA